MLSIVMAVITDPVTMLTYSTPDQIAQVVYVYEAATDGKEQIRYLAGDDANAIYAQPQQVGAEAFRLGMDQQFFG
jgi:hypothetical protein